MSVVMASVYITVHLFGFTDTTRDTKQYANWNQCVNSLEIYEAKHHNKPNLEITFDREKGFLKISNTSDKTIEAHQCQKE